MQCSEVQPISVCRMRIWTNGAYCEIRRDETNENKGLSNQFVGPTLFGVLSPEDFRHLMYDVCRRSCVLMGGRVRCAGIIPPFRA